MGGFEKLTECLVAGAAAIEKSSDVTSNSGVLRVAGTWAAAVPLAAATSTNALTTFATRPVDCSRAELIRFHGQAGDPCQIP